MTMRMTPDARSLLNVALETYRTAVLPGLPPERRYEGLMIANALAIAAREFGGLEAAGSRMLAALAELCGEEADPTLAGPALAERVEALQRRLCADIAAGDYDAPDIRAPLLRCLECLVEAQLAISNPKLLAG